MNALVTNGTGGGAYYGDTANHAGAVSAVQVIADAKFHTLTGNVSGVANVTSGSAATIPAGTILFGSFTALQLHSGSVIAYK